ncbi:MAG: serine/threonine-protein phosphatase, partial [Holophagales bacterium]|nr:serine/threonine-protein phosphatase [Holophagales bacterium]
SLAYSISHLAFFISHFYLALALASFDPATGELELVNAGLPDPYVIAPDGSSRTLEAPQPRLPLGLRGEVAYVSVRTRMAPGERLLMLTDGLPEAPVRPGEPLGYEALRTYLDHRDEDPIRWLETLLERLQAATLDELDDDWTALILERSIPGRAAGETAGPEK